jgi:hypothetical protein
MSTLSYFLLGLVVSMSAIFYLRSINEKRRRVIGKNAAPILPQYHRLGWALAVLPGVVSVIAGQTSAFLAWCGAVTVCSWLIVSRTRRPRTTK